MVASGIGGFPWKKNRRPALAARAAEKFMQLAWKHIAASGTTHWNRLL
jgi:hypothetical protein